MQDVATLVEEIERLADGESREKARAAVAAVLDLHAPGLARLLEALRRHGGDAAVQDVAREEAVGGLLLLHGLHPVSAEARVRAALDALGPALRKRSAAAELLSTEDCALHVRVREAGAAARGATAAVEEALCAAAPDAVLVVERSVEPTVGALVPVDRLRAPRARPRDGESESCELCGAPVGPRHEHLVDPRARELRCACGACATLFAGGGDVRWKRVPRRAEPLADFQLPDAAWDALGIPIELAFFFRSSVAGRVVAYYPGPAGATESLLSLEAWTRLETDNPVLRDFVADVEALLVRRARGAREYYRVSIDVCYELVGHIRKHWRGLSGGGEAWTRIAEFFDVLRGAPPGGPNA